MDKSNSICASAYSFTKSTDQAIIKIKQFNFNYSFSFKIVLSSQQKIIEKAAKESANYEFELMEKSYEEDKKFLEQHGIKFTTPSPEFTKQMQEAVQPLYDELFKKYDWAKDLYERIKAEAK